MSLTPVSPECKSPQVYLEEAGELEAIPDVRLREVVRKCYTTGSTTPLIKEELKLKIQTKRLREGKKELTVDLKPVVKIEPPSDDDIIKQTERREKNNLAARQYRKRLKGGQETVIEEHDRLEASNKKLQEMISEMKKQKETLSRLLSQHSGTCQMLKEKPAQDVGPWSYCDSSSGPLAVRQDSYMCPEATSPLSGQSFFDKWALLSGQPPSCDHCSYTNMLFSRLPDELSVNIPRPASCLDVNSEGTPSPQCCSVPSPSPQCCSVPSPNWCSSELPFTGYTSTDIFTTNKSGALWNLNIPSAFPFPLSELS